MTDTAHGTQDLALIDVVAQWRAESLQVINWGGFHGHREIDLSSGSTLISGAPAPARAP